MSRFVEECRREWKRLRVPDAVADDMANELDADLAEAAADGVAPEELLGSGASDPRSFAAAWAAARGVDEPSPPRLRGRRVIAAVTAAFVIVAVVGAVLAIVGGPARRTGTIGVLPSPDQAALWVAAPDGNQTVGLEVMPPRLLGGGSTGDLREAGLLVLVVGVGGMVLTALVWSSYGAAPRLRTL